MNEQAPDAQAIVKRVSDLCGRNWWVFLVGGIAAIVFGVLAFMKPGIALLVLALYFAVYILFDGFVNIWGAISNRDAEGWWAVLLLGIVGVVVGGYALLYPPASMLALIYIVSVFAMLIGLTSIYLGWKIRAEVDNEWVLFLMGGLSVIFSVTMIVNPAVGGLSVAYMVASWAIFIGILRIWFAMKMRKLGNRAADATA